MPLLKRTEEDRAAEAARKQHERDVEAARREREQREAEERRRQEEIERQRRAFYATPAGKARTAYQRGDYVFQYSMDVMNQTAIIVPMVGSNTVQKTSDPVAILNSVCREGWELVNGGFVFVEQGQQSRDKFMSSGQNVAIKGTTVGYYLFKRCEQNRCKTVDPWEVQQLDEEGSDEALFCVDCGGTVAPQDKFCPNCGAEFAADYIAGNAESIPDL